ncbi:AAA family ATPase [Cellulophaga baltica]|uniref:AAA family ATPase n=1 Tax=Cellulophaga baltica TaxID=76594 RepID=UPI002495231A|nr:AAA family ATPase [Cellulophaga baltica]
MKIKSLHARQIGLFNSLDVEFNSGFNFITGPNASGKTSILRNISLAITHYSIRQFRYREGAEVWVDFYDNSNAIRVGYGKNAFRNIELYQGAELYNWVKPEVSEEVEVLTPNDLESKNFHLSPLFISAFRKISYVKVKGMTQEDDRKKQIVNYRNQSTNNLIGKDMPNVKQWLINRYFQIEKDWAVNEKKNWEWLTMHLEQLAPKNSNFKFVRIERDLEPIFSVNGSECYLEELSSGYQAILSIIFCVFDWIEGTNEGTKMLVKNANGTVLIDELDAHLHPEWQLTIRNSLSVLFPKLQFIITTHSPHLIASAKAKELLIIPQHNGDLILKPSNKTYSGWNTDQILEELMGVKSLTNKTYTELISQSLNLIESKNISELQKSINKLKKVAHSNDTIVDSLEIKLASLKLTQND